MASSRARRPSCIHPVHNLPPIVRLWALRLLVPLGGQKEFISHCGYEDAGLAQALGLGESLECALEEHSVPAMRTELRAAHLAAERAAGAMTVPRPLVRNVERLGDLVGLDQIDRRLLEFAVVLHGDPLLASAANQIGTVASAAVHNVLAGVLHLPPARVRASLDSRGVLARSGLLTMEPSNYGGLDVKLSLLSDCFADHILHDTGDPAALLRETVLLSPAGHLSLDDFEHLASSLSILCPYLRHAVAAKRLGVNILLHGAPGSGKNQLTKALAADIACDLFEVSAEDSDGDPVSGEKRLRSYRAAQSVLSKSHALLLFDEVEDVFQQSGWTSMMGGAASHSHKAWINRALEGNPVPAFWLCNSISSIDGAFLRRFDMVLEVPIPPRRQRQKIALQTCGGLASPAALARIADCETLAPAVLARAAQVVRCIEGELGQAMASSAIECLVGQTLKAQGHAGLSRPGAYGLPPLYDPAYTCADIDLGAMADGITRAGSARICLYGPPGTGKTAWAHWLARSIGRPLQIRRASDLLSKWLGETEQRLAGAFQQAQSDGAVLLIDEVDSFLQDRRAAQQGWEITQVNEMLTQMEDFAGIFIACTNLMDGLDPAAMRRFDLKARLDYLAVDQAWALLGKYAAALGLAAPGIRDRQLLASLDCLTPGDFAGVARQHRFRTLASASALVDALQREQEFRQTSHSRCIGFLRQPASSGRDTHANRPSFSGQSIGLGAQP